ncbi:MAG TPA: S8 family serine peptidase [Thermoanaerobaculia bacterium]|jgi:subtilisin family serine protease|nr:S8 family serine peptidase [Thermoanaerobaculia bacterium]
MADLNVQVDLPRLGRALAWRRRADRRASVVAALKDVARRSQAALAPFLDEARRQGLVHTWRGFAAVNRLLVEATPAGIAALARRPEVVAIVGETEISGPALAATPEPEPPARTSWGIESVGAPELWHRGLDGTGVVVGIIDSGASATHEQLAGSFRGGARSWLDPRGRSAAPQDNWLGHGTGVLSCAVGRNTGGVTLGVAPGAQWIACAGLPEGRYNNVLATVCADWMLTQAQPDVLVIAWVLPTAGCDRSLQPLVDAWRAAEILPVFAAGNHGPAAGTDRSPANYFGLYPGGRAALSVGGLARGGGPYAANSRGPSSCGAPAFPVLVAPAEDLPAAFPLAPSTYVQARGTSHAAGFVAGAAALLLQRHPEASVSELEDALAGGATDLGGPGPDGTFGYGRLDIPAALARLDLIRTRRRP